MRKRSVVRLQLILLAVIVVLLLYRSLSGPPGPDGFVVLEDLDKRDLTHRVFELEKPSAVRIVATGSFEEAVDAGAADVPLAAYAWVVRRDDGSVAWRMQGADARAERGTLAAVEDTVQLMPGTYDVYFTSYGNSFGRGRDSGFSILRNDDWTDDDIRDEHPLVWCGQRIRQALDAKGGE